MGALDDFLLGANDELDSLLGTSSMTCDGQTFDVVSDGFREANEGASGGLEWDIRATVTAQPKHVRNPRQMLKKRCMVDGAEYRIEEVTVGTVAIHFTLIDPNQPD